jgi:tetratricopeptide (TPR) repeat protein
MFYWFLVLVCCLIALPAQAASRPELFRHAKDGTVLIVAINDSAHSVSMGSGFFVNDEGLLVTNAHVIEESSRLYVYARDQVIYAAPQVVASDPDLDLAALRVPWTDGQILALVSDLPSEGTDVIAVGYPRITDILQMGFALHATAGTGTVSGVVQGRSRTKGRPSRFIQTTGILNFGNSGGPLVNMETGQVAGMVVTTVPYQERAKDRAGMTIGSVTMKSGIGYSIPAPVIQQWLESHQLAMRASAPRRTFTESGTEPTAERSFATGHLLHTIALVLRHDSDLLQLAIDHYENAAAMKPDAAWMTRNLGQAYAAVGQWDRALEVYLKGLDQTPHDAALLSDAGLACERTGRRDRAVEFYRAAVRADPRSGRAHNNLGHLLQDMGRVDDAIVEFRKAIALEPGLGPAAYNLGSALEAKGLKEEALKTWQMFLTTAGANADSDEWTQKMRESVLRLGSTPQPALPALATPVRKPYH